MSEELFDIVFKGELVRSFELSVVKKNISQLFKIDGAKLEALFSGKSVILKRNLDFDTAAKYRAAIKKAGAIVSLTPVENIAEPVAAAPPSPPAPSLPPQPRAVFGEHKPALDTAPQAAENKDYVSSETYAMNLAPVGVDMLASSERKEVVSAIVDTSAISLRECGADLLDASEKTQTETLDIDLSAIELAPPEGDLLKPHERKQVAAVKVDVSGMSLAEPGARLSQPSPPPPPAPDVSKIKLAP